MSDTLVLSYGITGVPQVNTKEGKREGSKFVCVEGNLFNVDELMQIESNLKETELDTNVNRDSIYHYIDSLLDKPFTVE